VTQPKLPLLVDTPRAWAELAADNLSVFLADHAVCEQHAALAALSLIARYPQDDELVVRMGALAAEEVSHLRRVTRLLHGRGLSLARRRPNPYAQALRKHIVAEREPELKVDRLLVGALIEARSCERFTCLGQALGPRDPEVAELLHDLGPAERRHWEIFHGLAAREMSAVDLESRWRNWLEWEREVIAPRGTTPTVHG
jgi:tRNA-(ms[2]io[6]A)-hydroxylase